VSTESGIPDFRSAGGLYGMKYKYPPETMLSHSFFVTHPEEFFDFYRSKILYPDARPNKAHLKLAEMEKAGKLTAVVTQNIDGLHLAAGSRRVIEAHGTLARFSCESCGRAADAAGMMREGAPIRCGCGGLIRPEVVLYGEGLDEIEAAFGVVDEADALLVLGTSLQVYPIAAIPQLFLRAGKPVVVVNREPTPYGGDAGAIEINAGIGATLRRLFA